MLVLGIIDSKPSSAAIVADGAILAAVAEERLCRMKMASGMPLAAITEVLRLAGVTPEEVDGVAVGQEVSVFAPEPMPWVDWFGVDGRESSVGFEALGSLLAPWLGAFPLAWKAHGRVKRWLRRDRLEKLPRLLRQRFAIEAPVRFYDHHYCHAVTAHYAGGFDDALIVTLDGGGDGLSGSVYRGSGGTLERLATVDSYNSLGNFYSYVTALCGFKAERHEGKITGLAALGAPSYAPILREFVAYRDPGEIRYGINGYHRSAVERLRKRLPRDFDRAALAASAQLVLEEVATAFVRYWLGQTGARNLAVAGGVFANVKLNQRLHELDEVDSLFVYPAMDDGGLAIGSAMALFADREKGSKLVPRRLADVYFGPEYSDQEVEAAISGAELIERPADVQQCVASLLTEGYVVARFVGRMEYGPRALGHRSILYPTTDPSVNDWLNDHLGRTEFMPFAPATLSQFASRCYKDVEKAADPPRFMTVTFDCTRSMRDESPGVVHADGTARPQLVDSDTAPDLYAILTHYERATGIPSIVNTSFNMHEEPIVCTPEDAIRAFRLGRIDYLAINDLLVSNPEGPRQRTAGSIPPR
jgi:carbamoyltransferase